jgi:hypothetical protein
MDERRNGMWRKTAVGLLVLVLAVVSFQCKKKSQILGLSLDVTFSDENLTDNLMTDMQYRWKTDSRFEGIEGNPSVYVHFWHKNNLLFQDDHQPEIPVSEWKPGEEYVYTRKIYIPEFIDEFDPDFTGEETLKLSVGFYSPGHEAEEPTRAVLEKKLKVSPPPLDTPEIIYEDGWYDLEIDPASYLKRWRWTAQEARCIIDNPKKDAFLMIRGGVNLEALDDQKVIFKINDWTLDEFIPEESYFEKSYNIKKEMMGEGEEFFLTIATDKVFIPSRVIAGSKDERQLGVQISFIYFR